MVTTKEDYRKNKESILAYQKEYRKNSDVWRKANKHWIANNPEKMKLYRAKYFRSPKGKLTKLKLRAKRANIPFNIKLPEYIEWVAKQNRLCHYCGNELNVNEGHKMLDGDSIDRKDNNKGYFIDNIVLSCNKCNMIKGSWFTEGQMLEIAKKYL